MTSHFALWFSPRRVLLCAVLALAFWPTSLLAEDSYPPRPISDAERAALEAVVGFLEGGPKAVLTRLAADSPMRVISTSHAVEEIEVRMGTPEGSTWTLQTPGRAFEDRSDLAIFSVEFASGLDDIILMDMKQENGSWVIHQVRCAVDPRMPRETAEDEMHQFFRQNSGAVLPGGVPGATAPPGATGGLAPWSVPAALVGCLLLSTFLLSMFLLGHHRRRHASAVGLLAAVVVVGGCGLFSGEDEVEEIPYVELDALDLSPLLPLRRVLTAERGREAEQRAQLHQQVGELVKELVGALDTGDEVSVAARAWQAQLMVLDGSLAPAAKILEAIPLPDSLPLTAIVRGRLAAENHDPTAVQHWENARKLGPDHDGLALEAAWSVYGVGDEGAMERHMRSQVYMRSRQAVGHYFAARFDAVQGQNTAAAGLFLSGWAREPLSRFELFRDPLLTQSTRHPSVFEALDLMNREQGSNDPATASEQPLAIPPGATSHILGEHLIVTLDDRGLRVPGGGDLAPEGTVVESAEGRADREADETIARFDELTAEMSAGAPLRRTDRQAVETTSQNLLRRRQWQTLIQLTDPLASKPEHVPPSLMQNRALALIRTGKSTAAAELLAVLGQDDQLRRTRPPMTYYQLGEMLVELERYEPALRATQRASGLGAHEFITTRAKQIELMAALHRDTSTFDSRHFRMIYPAPANESYPRQLSWVMEAEWTRIGHWIPVRGRARSEVDVVPHGLYTEAYAKAGTRAAGLYDGTPRVPFAEFETFQEDFVRTLTHQTAHAMIDQATRGRAPKWFQEGLARHVEMHQRDANPMHELHEQGRALSVQLLDPILDGWVDSQLVDTASAHATWAVRYVESRKGVAGIHSMLGAYRRGDDTAGALRSALGTSVRQFDRDFHDWALQDAPLTWRTEVVSYLDQFREERKREALDPLQTEADKTRRPGGDEQQVYSADKRRQMMREWHGDYAEAVRPVKVALAKALPLIQGQADGDVAGACRELRGEIDRFLGNRQNLDAPDKEVAAALNQAYSSFLDMTQKCRSRRWQDMRSDMDRAIQGLGQAQAKMQPYGLEP